MENNWEVSIIELENGIGKKYKVTRRMSSLSIAETKVFRSKEQAIKQLEEWLQ
jgi:hypothetical protein|tara:strand:+ start:1400 stop:1558 length:159 start_codon:yes stop_codon:yes gene_type:complete